MRLYTLFICSLLLTGCMQLKMLPYLDQALTLKAFGHDKDEQDKFVKNVDAKFDQLMTAVGSGQIRQYKTEKEIVKFFGPPIMTREDTIGGQPVIRALYRYAIQSKGPHKVYLYYNPSGQLVQWEKV